MLPAGMRTASSGSDVALLRRLLGGDQTDLQGLGAPFGVRAGASRKTHGLPLPERGIGQGLEELVQGPRLACRGRRRGRRRRDRCLSGLGGRQHGRLARRRQLLAQGLLLHAQLLELPGVLPPQALDDGIALGVHALAEAELLQAGVELVGVVLQTAQALGQALDADGTGVGVGQQVGDQAPALVAAAGALVLGRGNQERGECQQHGDGTAEHQPAAQRGRQPVPAVLQAHRRPPRSDGRSSRPRAGSRGRRAR